MHSKVESNPCVLYNRMANLSTFYKCQKPIMGAKSIVSSEGVIIVGDVVW